MKILAFKPGEWNGVKYDESFSRALAQRYNESGRQAALVVGHRFLSVCDEDEHAHGWVKRLEVEAGGVLYACVDGVSEEVRAWVKSGKLKHASIEFSHKEDAQGCPVEPDLQAIALLGRRQPAVTGAQIVQLSAHPENKEIKTMCIHCLENLKAEGEDTMSKEEQAALEAQLKSAQAALAQKERELAALQDESASTALQAQLQSAQAQVRAFEQAERQRQSASFAGELRSAGKVVPAQCEAVAALHAKLEGDMQAAFESLMRALPQQVELGNEHRSAEPAHDGASVSERVRAFQKKHALESYADALEVLSTEDPELYTAAMQE